MKVLFRLALVGLFLLVCISSYGQIIVPECPPFLTQCGGITADLNFEEPQYCEGESVFIDLTNPTGLIDSFFVEWGDGDISSFSADDVMGNSMVSHPFTFNDVEACEFLSSVGFYQVELTILWICDQGISTHCQNAPINISIIPRPSFNSDSPVCVGEFVQFNNTTCPPGEYTYMWDLGDGNTSTAENPQHPYQQIGDYTVTLTATSNDPDCPGLTNTTTRQISVEGPPIPSYIPTINGIPLESDTICIGTALDMENTSIADSYIWDSDNNGVNFSPGDTSVNPIVTFPGAGTYEVELTASNATCPDEITSQIFTVVEAEDLSLGEDVTVCTFDPPVIITPDPNYLGTYNIKPDTFPTMSPMQGELMGQILTVTPSNYAEYDSLRICYAYTDENGCNGIANMTITIEGSANLDLPPPPPICNTNYNFDLLGLPEPPGTSGSWVNLDGTGGIVNDSLFNPDMATGSSPYNLEYTFTSEAGCVSKDTIIVVVEDIPPTDASMNASLICNTGQVMLTGSPACYPPLCVWGPAGSISPEGVIIGTPIGPQTYTYTTNVGTPCEDSDSVQVEIVDLTGIDAGEDVQVCENESTYTLTANTPGGTWSESDASLNSINPNTGEVNISALTADEYYTYYYTVESQNIACSNVDSLVLYVQTAPTLDIETTCSGDTLNLSANTDATTFDIQWDFNGDGTTDASGVNTSFIVGANGLYDVTATLQSDSCRVTDTISGMLNPIPQPDFTIMQADTCSPSPITFINNTDVLPDDYLIWTISSGDTFYDYDIGTIPFEITVDTAVTFYVTLTTCNDCGCNTALDSFQVFPSPQAFFVTDFPSYCSGEWVQMTTVDTLYADSCVWNYGGEIYVGCDSPDWQAISDTLVYQEITLTTYSECDTSVYSDIIEIKPTNVEAFIYTEPSDTVCLGTEICFESYSTPLTNLQWIVGDGLTPIGDTAFCHIFSTPGTFPVILRASDCGYDEDTVIIHIDSLPAQPIFTVQQTGCVGDEIVFEIENYDELDSLTYEWDYGDSTDTIQVGYSTTHVYDSIGTYMITLTVEGLHTECVNQWQQMVTIEDERPTASFEAGPLAVCLGESVDFTDMSFNGVSTYSWSFGDGNTSGISSPSNTYTQPGTYTVVLTVGNATASCFDSDSIEIIVHDLPEVELMGNDVLCAGANTGSVAAMVLGGTPNYSFLWSNGANTPSIDEIPAGDYSVTITDMNLCQATANITLSQPTETLTIISEATPSLCAGVPAGRIDIEADGGTPPYTFLWNTGDTSEDLDGLVSNVYSITVTDGNGCIATDNIYVDSSDDLLMDVEVTPITCAGESNAIIEVLEVANGTAPFIYTLISESGDTSISTFPRFSELSAGNYEVHVLDANDCFDSIQVEIIEPDSLEVTIGANIIGDTFNFGEELILEAIHNAAALDTVIWSPIDYLQSPDSTTTLVTPPSDASVTYTVEITDAQGCTANDTRTFYISSRRNVFIPNAFSPNDDGANDRFVIHAGLGVSQVNQLQIFDRWGEMVFERTGFQPNDREQGWDGTFRGKKAQSGVYVYIADISFVDGVTKPYMGSLTLVR